MSATIGIELCDVGLLAATCAKDEPQLIDVPATDGSIDWPGFSYMEGSALSFGATAENMWFVHPRRVAHNFWARLNHEPSTLTPPGKRPHSFSELAFFFLRSYAERLRHAAPTSGQIVLALPGAYLKDAAAEEEKVGLLLGMAMELKLPLAGMIDMACAALCDPRSEGFDPTRPLVVLDVHLDGADLTLFTAAERLCRSGFLHIPQAGYAQLLKHLTGTMGNRFLSHTAFDILEDGRIEQTFFRQTKDFLLSDAPEHRFHINTATRGYEMIAKREQLAADSASFSATLVQQLLAFARTSADANDSCALALTDRASHIPGLEPRLRAAGFTRILHLPRGAAAYGAARIGAARLTTPADLADVPVEVEVPLSDARHRVELKWDVRLLKNRDLAAKPAPTHAILHGLGHALHSLPRFTIGSATAGADLPLPDSFGATPDCLVPLAQENGRLWFSDPGHSPKNAAPHAPHRALVETGDRLIIRCGAATAEILFAHCPVTTGLLPS